MTTDPLAQFVVELRTVVRDEVRAAMATRAPTEVIERARGARPVRVPGGDLRAGALRGLRGRYPGTVITTASGGGCAASPGPP